MNWTQNGILATGLMDPTVHLIRTYLNVDYSKVTNGLSRVLPYGEFVIFLNSRKFEREAVFTGVRVNEVIVVNTSFTGKCEPLSISTAYAHELQWALLGEFKKIKLVETFEPHKCLHRLYS